MEAPRRIRAEPPACAFGWCTVLLWRHRDMRATTASSQYWRCLQAKASSKAENVDMKYEELDCPGGSSPLPCGCLPWKREMPGPLLAEGDRPHSHVLARCERLSQQWWCCQPGWVTGHAGGTSAGWPDLQTARGEKVHTRPKDARHKEAPSEAIQVATSAAWLRVQDGWSPAKPRSTESAGWPTG